MKLFIKNLLFTLIITGSVAGYVPNYLSRDAVVAPGAWPILSYILFVVGVSIYLWCLWDFATFGRGTPAPIDAPKKLVIRGLYHYTRNPMYVGMLTTVLGWVVMFQASKLYFYVLLFSIIFHIAVVFYEEPHLKKLFGDDYDQYRSRVGRWWPKLGRKSIV